MNQNLIDIFRLLGAKLMHTADQHEVICINPSQFYKFRDVVFSAQNDLELLRSEIEALKNQITAYQLTIANMEAEREAMMNPKGTARPTTQTEEDAELMLKALQELLGAKK